MKCNICYQNKWDYIPCNHYFKECLSSWLNIEEFCPIVLNHLKKMIYLAVILKLFKKNKREHIFKEK